MAGFQAVLLYIYITYRILVGSLNSLFVGTVGSNHNGIVKIKYLLLCHTIEWIVALYEQEIEFRI